MPDALLTRREAAELSGTSETTVKKAVDLHVITTRRRDVQSGIEPREIPVLVMLGHLNGVGLAATHKRSLRRWLRTPGAPAELPLVPGLVVRRLDDVVAAATRAAGTCAYAHGFQATRNRDRRPARRHRRRTAHDRPDRGFVLVSDNASDFRPMFAP